MGGRWRDPARTVPLTLVGRRLGARRRVLAHVIQPVGASGRSPISSSRSAPLSLRVIGAGRRPVEHRFSWKWIAVGVALSAIADTIYYLLGWIGRPWATSRWPMPRGSPPTSPSAIGLSSLIVGGHGVRRVDVDGLTDIGSFAVSGRHRRHAVRAPCATSSKTPPSRCSTRTVGTAYPILDAALLAVVAQAMVSRRLRDLSGVLLSCGVACGWCPISRRC